jgi:hypothetical protein
LDHWLATGKNNALSGEPPDHFPVPASDEFHIQLFPRFCDGRLPKTAADYTIQKTEKIPPAFLPAA